MKSNNMIKKLISFILLVALIMNFSVLIVSAEPEGVTEPYYELSAMGDTLTVYGDYDFSKIEVPDTVMEINIENSTLDKPLPFEDLNVTLYYFRDCVFNVSDIGLPIHTETIQFEGMEFANLHVISKYKNLKMLFIGSSIVASLEGIESLESLDDLSLFNVGIESIEEIGNLKNLTSLSLNYTCVNDLSPITGMNIEVLSINNSPNILDLSPVMTLKNLREFLNENCEMAITQEVLDFLSSNSIYTYADQESLKIKNEIKSLASNLFNDSMSDEEKIRVAVRYARETIKYDEGVEDDEWLSTKYNSAALYYALQGIGVCRNYTALTTALLQEEGIKVFEIRSDDHIWNLVELENKYYWIDVTWLELTEDDSMFLSDYYMNGNYEFVDHEPLTIVTSMYNKQFKLNEDGNNSSETDESIDDSLVGTTEDNSIVDNVEDELVDDTDNSKSIILIVVISILFVVGVIVVVLAIILTIIIVNKNKKKKVVNKIDN